MEEIGLDGLTYTITLDDDPVIGKMIEGSVGVKTFSYATTTALLADARIYQPLGAFIDVHLASEESGLDIIPQLKTLWPNTPIIVVTADPESSLIASALAAGADDFVRKPLDDVELRARLNARLGQIAERRGHSVLNYGDVTLDVINRTLVGPLGRQLLSGREAGLLAELVKARGLVVSKIALKKQLWGGLAISDNALDRKIFEVRRLLKAVTDQLEVKAVYGEGVKLQRRSHETDNLLLDDFEVRRKVKGRPEAPVA